MKLVFFGLPLGALLLGNDGHEIALAALPFADALGRRRLERRLGTRRVLVRPDVETPRFFERVARLEPELVVSWFWTRRLPKELLHSAPNGALGVHPSLLPRHRGPDPYFWAIYEGDTETGVTAHRLEEEYDTGAILGQRVVAIDPSWNAWTLARALDRPSLGLLREVVGAIARGESPAPRVQDERDATLANAPDAELLAIRWQRPTDALVRLVRAASPWPGAYTELGGRLVVLTEVSPCDDFPRALEPGEGGVREEKGRRAGFVRTKDGAVWLRAGRIEADSGDIELDAPALAELLVARGAGTDDVSEAPVVD